VFDVIARLTESLLSPLAGLLEPFAGSSRWGWAVLLGSILWRLPLWPLSMRRTRLRARPRPAAAPPRWGRWGRGPATSSTSDTSSTTDTSSSSASTVSPVPAGPPLSRLDRVAIVVPAVLEFIAFVLVLVWAYAATTPDQVGFVGVERLSSRGAASFGGVVLALLLVASMVAVARWFARASGPGDDRQRFFLTWIMPTGLPVAALVIPVAVTLAWLGGNLVQLAVLAAVRPPVLTESVSERREVSVE
jgi:hypothetical protein